MIITIQLLAIALIAFLSGFTARMLSSVSMKTFKEQYEYCQKQIVDKNRLTDEYIKDMEIYIVNFANCSKEIENVIKDVRSAIEERDSIQENLNEFTKKKKKGRPRKAS